MALTYATFRLQPPPLTTVTPPLRYDQPAHAVGLTRILPDHLVPERNGAVAWWSNIKREGEWILPRKFRSFACMGNVEIDLRSAHMAEGTSSWS